MATKPKQIIEVKAIVYTVREAAEALRLSESKMYDLINTGRIPSIMIDSSRRVSVRRLEEWVDHLTEQQMTELWGADWRKNVAA